MKSINTNAWLVNFMLSFSGLSPLFNWAKSQFFSNNVTQKAATMCTPVELDPKNGPTLIKFHLKTTIGPNKIYFELYEQR
jgi:hypothetical protein